ncbi:glycosyltransferase family 2 protein [Candidatus Dependentiae bacterium]|nr:glycosyltransferase family 2 protein [Candidatus Dependentiae bacterium]
MKKISIIILFYNGERFYQDCLSSLRDALTGDEEVLLIDNNSKDSTYRLIKQDFPEFNTIKLKKNLGFSGGMNFGIKRTSASIVLILNQDIIVDKNLIKNINSGFSEEVGIIGCKIYFPGTKTLQHTGGIIHPNGLTNHIGYKEIDRGQYNKTKEVDYVTGAAFAIKRRVIETLGYFDRDFFPGYYEETDLCYRSRLSGQKVIYKPDCVIYHHEATTLGSNSFRYLNTYHRNRLRFVWKNFTITHILFKALKFEIKWWFINCPRSNYIPLILAYLNLIPYIVKWVIKKIMR